MAQPTVTGNPKDISKAVKPETFTENQEVAHRGGMVASVARQALEAETGQPVITPQNAAQLNAVVVDMIEGAAEAVDEKEPEKEQSVEADALEQNEDKAKKDVEK